MKIRLLLSILSVSMVTLSSVAQEKSLNQNESQPAKVDAAPERVRRPIAVTEGSSSSATATDLTRDPNYKPVDLPGFPVYINTGNSEQDALNYQKAKEEWVKSNPDAYSNFISANTENEFSKTGESKKSSLEQGEKKVEGYFTISQEEFDALPLEKKQYLLANPEQYLIKKN